MTQARATTANDVRMRVLRASAAAVIAAALLVGLCATAEAAVGCTLNDPDRDVIRIFPEATSYRTEFISISERGGDSLAVSIERTLCGELDPVFEALDVPYAYYTVLDGTEIIGRIHGVNQKGMYGGMQLILATDPSGTVIDFYYQKLSSPEAGRFRDDAFTSRFIGLRLRDALAMRNTGAEPDATPGRSPIEDPSSDSAGDYQATVRGITKNLLLLHAFFSIGEPAEQTNEGGER